MFRFIVRRALLAVPVMLAVTVLAFFLTDLVPGDAARTILGSDATAGQVEALREEMRLDDPIVIRYVDWAASALTGDLGRSLLNNQPVDVLLGQRLPVTLTLIVASTALAMIVGVAFGVISALRGGVVGRILDVLSALGQAVPDYWLALLLVIVFAVQLRLFPATGWVPPGADTGGWLSHIVLPVVALAIGGVTALAKQTKDSMTTALRSDVVTALRAVGLPRRRIIGKHALRNAAIPVLTTTGLVFVGSVGGTVLIEQVFALPGLGGLAVSSTLFGDIPTIQGLVVCFTVIVIVVNLVIDIAYGILNPKVRVS